MLLSAMKNGYKILWTDWALNELEIIIEYLKNNFTEKELKKLASTIEETLHSISLNPNLYQTYDENRGIYRVVILTYNTMYYRIKNDQIEIISFFSNRQNPSKKKLK